MVLGLAVLKLRLDLHVLLRVVGVQLGEVFDVPLERIHDGPDDQQHDVHSHETAQGQPQLPGHHHLTLEEKTEAG